MKLEKTLSMALIQCHIDYSCSFWYADISKGLKNKLHLAQKIRPFLFELHIVEYELRNIPQKFCRLIVKVAQLK